MSVNFEPAILGPEMAVPILWAPRKIVKFHRTMEMIPARPWYSKSPSVSTPFEQSTKQGNARGTSEVWRRTSSIHFHCLVPRSSSHIGHGGKYRFYIYGRGDFSDREAMQSSQRLFRLRKIIRPVIFVEIHDAREILLTLKLNLLSGRVPPTLFSLILRPSFPSGRVPSLTPFPHFSPPPFVPPPFFDSRKTLI